MNYLNNIDVKLLLDIHNVLQNSFFDNIMPIITTMGNFDLIWIVISIFLMLSKKYRVVGIMCLLSLFLSWIIGEEILKNIFQRPRPFIEINTIHLLIAEPTSYTFPSGHSASSFAAAGIISNKIEKLKLPIYSLAVLIAFSRLYLMVHFLSDVLAGAVLGFLCAKIVITILNKTVSIKSY